MNEVLGDHFFVSVTENTLEFAFGSGLHGFADLLVAGALFQAAGQVNSGNVSGRYAERHTGQLALHRGDNHADSLRGAGGGRDNIAQRRAAAAPVLVGRAVNGLLGGGGGMNGSHQAFDDAEIVIQHFNDRG